MNNKMITLSIAVKTLAIISSIYGIIKVYGGPLTFTYFTTLSNIFISLILLVFLIKDIISYKSNKKIIYSDKLYIIKFLATISITLTFVVFLTILAPTMGGGIINAYLMNEAGSLFVHFITPILAIIDFLLFNNEYKIETKYTIYSIIPPLIYVLFITIASSLGLRWGNMAAPYNFLNFKAPTGWFGFDPSLRSWETLGIGVFYMIVLLSIIFIIIGRIFLWLKKVINSKMENN
ncbi:MAG: Pr6Pr family membrane protein [Bacilli bacterium]|nr:Pr6Pr family membrane protein [Bacilli bacterium]